MANYVDQGNGYQIATDYKNGEVHHYIAESGLSKSQADSNHVHVKHLEGSGEQVLASIKVEGGHISDRGSIVNAINNVTGLDFSRHL